MEVILHAGAHRTATTSFQRMLGHHGAALEAAGLAYWGPRRTRGGLCTGLIGAAPAILPWQRDRACGRLALRAAQAEAAGAAMLLVSEENMLGGMRALLDGPRLYPDAGARVARFAEGFGARRLTLGLGIRCYDVWWSSVLAFRLPRGGPVPGRDWCDRLVTQPRRWRHVIADLAAALPRARLVVWSHEALADRPDALLGALTGRHLDVAAPALRHNPAPRADALRQYLADCGGDPARLRADAAGRWQPFDAAQRHALAAQYAEDLAWLSAGAGGRAEYLGGPPARGAVTGLARGRSHDGQNRRLA